MDVVDNLDWSTPGEGDVYFLMTPADGSCGSRKAAVLLRELAYFSSTAVSAHNNWLSSLLRSVQRKPHRYSWFGVPGPEFISEDSDGTLILTRA